LSSCFKKKFHLKNLIVVADSGLLSRDNIENLKSRKYEFIIGAQIKKEEKNVRERIFAFDLKDGESASIKKNDLMLIITYS
jgi:transposase